MKIAEIPSAALDELRPVVQRGLGLQAWPGDWEVVGLILTTYNLVRVEHRQGEYHAAVWSKGQNGYGHAQDPQTALFRGFVLMRCREEAERATLSAGGYAGSGSAPG